MPSVGGREPGTSSAQVHTEGGRSGSIGELKGSKSGNGKVTSHHSDLSSHRSTNSLMSKGIGAVKTESITRHKLFSAVPKAVGTQKLVASKPERARPSDSSNNESSSSVIPTCNFYSSIEMATTTSKQKGLYCSIPENLQLSPEDHVRAAKALKFGKPENCIPPYLRNAVMKQAEMSITQHRAIRARNINHWKNVKEKTPRGSERFHANLMEKLDHECDLLKRGNSRFSVPLPAVRIAREKWDVVGVLREPLLFSDKECLPEPPISVRQLLNRQNHQFRTTRASILRDSESGRKTIWDTLNKEVERGYARLLGRESDITPSDWASMVFYRRFVVKQLKQDKKGMHFATRAIDDGGNNGASDLVCIKSRVDVNTVDQLVDTTKLFVQELNRNNNTPLTSGCACNNTVSTQCGRRSKPSAPCTTCSSDGFGAVVVDQSRAYRIVPVKDDMFRRCIPAVDPNGNIVIYQMDVLMFGESGSPLGYNCVARCLALCLSEILVMPIAHYYDDFISPIRIADDRIEQDILDVFALFEFPVSDKNQVGAEVVYLGVQLSFTAIDIKFALTKYRIEKLLFILRSAYNTNSLRASPAGKLQGKLVWASLIVYGRIGNSMTRPIGNRSTAKNLQPGAWLNTNLRNAIVWWCEFLEWLDSPDNSSRARAISLTQEPERCVVYSDASEYGLGVVLFARTFTAFISLDIRNENNETIGVWEAAAVALCLACFAQELASVIVLMMVDNNGVLGSLVKGYSNCKTTSSIVRSFWAAVAHVGTAPWFEKVQSESNIADAPSRLFSIQLKSKQRKHDWLKSVRRASKSTVPIFEVRTKLPTRTSLLNALANDEVIVEDWTKCDA